MSGIWVMTQADSLYFIVGFYLNINASGAYVMGDTLNGNSWNLGKYSDEDEAKKVINHISNYINRCTSFNLSPGVYYMPRPGTVLQF